MGESLTTHISTHLNPADLATKVLPGGIKRDRTIDLVLFTLGILMMRRQSQLRSVRLQYYPPQRGYDGFEGFHGIVAEY